MKKSDILAEGYVKSPSPPGQIESLSKPVLGESLQTTPSNVGTGDWIGTPSSASVTSTQPPPSTGTGTGGGGSYGVDSPVVDRFLNNPGSVAADEITVSGPGGQATITKDMTPEQARQQIAIIRGGEVLGAGTTPTVPPATTTGADVSGTPAVNKDDALAKAS